MTIQSNIRRLTIQILKERKLCLNVFDIVTIRRRGIRVKYCIHTCMHCMTFLLPILRLKLCNSSLHDFDSFCQKWQKVSLVTAKEIMRNIFEIISVKHNIPLSLFSSLPLSDLCLNLPWKWVSVLVPKNQRLSLKSLALHWH